MPKKAGAGRRKLFSICIVRRGSSSRAAPKAPSLCHRHTFKTPSITSALPIKPQPVFSVLDPAPPTKPLLRHPQTTPLHIRLDRLRRVLAQASIHNRPYIYLEFVTPMSEHANDDSQEVATQQQTQSTQQTNEPDPSVDAHLWGYLLPCSGSLTRIDFWKVHPRYTIGRNVQSNQVVLPGFKVSNSHCTITWDGKEDRDSSVLVHDLSSNGTYINGVKIGKGHTRILREGNEIAFGTCVPQPQNGGIEDYRFVYRHCAGGPATEGLWAHYDIGVELGKGSFATVMKAVSRKDGKWYAVKMIANRANRDGTDSASSSRNTAFAREIAIMEKLKHPNICELKEVFYEPRGDIHLVLELIEGGDLLDYIIRQSGLSEVKSRHITYQLCQALSYIHSQGVAHRDLKPENVLLTRGEPPIVKVADFGLAKVVDSLTMLRTMCGTPSYLAPEVVKQQNNEGYDNLVDSWSVGVIVFSMLTNSSPFIEDENIRDIRTRIAERTIDWGTLDEITPPLTQECKEFVQRLLDEDPTSRMTLTDACHHPWMLSYDPEDPFDEKPGKKALLVPRTKALTKDASMMSPEPHDGRGAGEEEDIDVDADGDVEVESRGGADDEHSFLDVSPGLQNLRINSSHMDIQQSFLDGVVEPGPSRSVGAANANVNVNVVNVDDNPNLSVNAKLKNAHLNAAHLSPGFRLKREASKTAPLQRRSHVVSKAVEENGGELPEDWNVIGSPSGNGDGGYGGAKDIKVEDVDGTPKAKGYGAAAPAKGAGGRAGGRRSASPSKNPGAGTRRGSTAPPHAPPAGAGAVGLPYQAVHSAEAPPPTAALVAPGDGDGDALPVLAAVPAAAVPSTPAAAARKGATGKGHNKRMHSELTPLPEDEESSEMMVVGSSSSRSMSPVRRNPIRKRGKNNPDGAAMQGQKAGSVPPESQAQPQQTTRARTTRARTKSKNALGGAGPSVEEPPRRSTRQRKA
ncbi:hypothetical protein AX16_008253 [Volvariella volvacea WC 439]|nr:hypothetical protein AX16_008253 [Volvariella volvacea WC 439]